MIYPRLSSCLILLCSAVGLYLTGLCLAKLLRRDTGTRINFVPSRSLVFPSFTVCSLRGYKENVVKAYGINKSKDLFYNGTMPNDTSNMMEFLEKARFSLEEFLISVDVKTLSKVDESYNHSLWTRTSETLPQRIIWTKVVKRHEGFCYTGTIANRYTEKGISMIKFVFTLHKDHGSKTNENEFSVSLHPSGHLLRTKEFKVEADIGFPREYKLEISKFEKIQDLDCDNEMDTGFDTCWKQAMLERLRDRIGCIFPWSDNVVREEDVCKNSSLYKEDVEQRIVSELKDIMRNDSAWAKDDHAFSRCRSPCRFEMYSTKTFSWSKDNLNDMASLELHFSNECKLTKEYYTYNALNFVGESGGYLGILIGFSFPEIVSIVLAYIQKLK